MTKYILSTDERLSQTARQNAQADFERQLRDPNQHVIVLDAGWTIRVIEALDDADVLVQCVGDETV
jgi:hypothetical protein